MSKISKENYQALLARRDGLLADLNTIDEKYEGIKNEHNLQLLNDLNQEKQQLLAQKENYCTALRNVEGRVQEITTRVAGLTGTGSEKIIQALAKQSFFFFINKPNVVFETTTGLFWPNMNTFPYNGGSGDSSGCYRKDFVDMPNDIDGMGGWRFPRGEEIYNFARNSKNPFREGDINRLKNCWGFWLEGNSYPYIHLDDSELKIEICRSNYSRWFLPCTSAMTDNTRFAVLTAGEEKILSPEQRAQLLLEFFLEKDLVPAFDDKTVTPLFEKLYLEKPALLEKLGKVEAEIAAAKEKVELTVDFDHRPLLEDYDLKAIAHSPLQYYTAVAQWAELLLEKLADYDLAQSSKVYKFQQLSKSFIYGDGCKSMKKRSKYLQGILDHNIGQVRKDLEQLLAQAVKKSNKLNKALQGKKILAKLAELTSAPRVDFTLLAEQTAKAVQQALYWTEYYAQQQEQLEKVLKQHGEWCLSWENHQEQLPALLEDLRKHLPVGEATENWLQETFVEEWDARRGLAEERLQPLLAKALTGGLESSKEGEPELVGQLLEALTNYRRDIDHFYLEDVPSLHETYLKSEGGSVKEAVENNLKVVEITAKFHVTLEKIIFSCAQPEDRYFIQQWANNLLHPVSEKLVGVAMAYDIPEELLTKLQEVDEENWQSCLRDEAGYKETREGWYKYMSRMFLEVRDACLEK